MEHRKREEILSEINAVSFRIYEVSNEYKLKDTKEIVKLKLREKELFEELGAAVERDELLGAYSELKTKKEDCNHCSHCNHVN